MNDVDMKHSIKYCDIYYFIFIILVGLAYFVFAFFTPPTLCDDIIYHCKFPIDGNYAHPVLIRSIGDVFESMKNFYLTMNNSRLIVQGIDQFFISLVPDHVTDLVNSLVFMLFVAVSVKFIGVEKRKRIVYGLLFVGLLFLLVKGFCSGLVWNCGSFNYLWVFPLTLGFLFFLQRKGSLPLKASYWLTSIPVILIGWSHEGIAIPVSLSLLLQLFLQRKERLHQLAFPLTIFYVIGSLLCISPGTLHRAVDNISWTSRIISGCAVLFYNIRILWLLVFTFVWVLWKRKDLFHQVLRERGYLWFAMLLSYGLAFACGENGPRVPLYAELLALVLLLDLWHHIFELRKSNIPRKIAAIVSVLALIVYIPSIYCCACNERLFSFMEKQMRTPGKELIATYNPCPDGAWMKYCYDNYVFPTCYFGFYSIYMGFDSHDSNMRCAATLYDKPFMYFLPEKIIEKANKGELKT